MRLGKPFKIVYEFFVDAGNSLDFNYQPNKEKIMEYWDEECIKHPTNSHCKIYYLLDS